MGKLIVGSQGTPDYIFSKGNLRYTDAAKLLGAADNNIKFMIGTTLYNKNFTFMLFVSTKNGNVYKQEIYTGTHPAGASRMYYGLHLKTEFYGNANNGGVTSTDKTGGGSFVISDDGLTVSIPYEYSFVDAVMYVGRIDGLFE